MRTTSPGSVTQCHLLAALLLVCCTMAGVVWAQTETAAPQSAPETQPAVIERLPIVLRDPKAYQTPLSLEPVTAIDLVAQVDGIVNTIPVELGQSVSRQAEAVRLDSTERQIELDRAKAAFQAAQAATAAASGERGRADVAAAQLEVAKVDLRLAEHRLEQTIVRVPFNGTITAVHVVPGQFVRAGDPVVRLADLTRMLVKLPVDRNAVKVAGTLELKVEDQTATGTVQAIRPLARQFEPLRELFVSVATAVVILDNAAGRFSEGQTVYSDLIPRAPVAEIPTLAVGSNVQGERRVQVIREGFVRDVTVELLGQAGSDYVFVTGRFGPTDELVVKSSRELRDGMRVLPASAPAESPQARPASPAGGRPRADF